MSTKIEELKNKIEKLKQKKHELEALAKMQDVFQHSYKIYLNSVYGFTGTQYSPVFSVDLAEAVTSTGRMTIQEMVRFTNKALVKIDNGGTGIEEYTVAGDTDSTFYDAIITIKNESIGDLFNRYYKFKNTEINENGHEILDIDNEYTYTLNGKTKIKSVSRHKVSKDKWKVSIDNNEVEMTGDHSIMIYRDGQIIECKPSEIKETDYLLKRKFQND